MNICKKIGVFLAVTLAAVFCYGDRIETTTIIISNTVSGNTIILSTNGYIKASGSITNTGEVINGNLSVTGTTHGRTYKYFLGNQDGNQYAVSVPAGTTLPSGSYSRLSTVSRWGAYNAYGNIPLGLNDSYTQMIVNVSWVTPNNEVAGIYTNQYQFEYFPPGPATNGSRTTLQINTNTFNNAGSTNVLFVHSITQDVSAVPASSMIWLYTGRANATGNNLTNLWHYWTEVICDK